MKMQNGYYGRITAHQYPAGNPVFRRLPAGSAFWLTRSIQNLPAVHSGTKLPDS